MEFKKPRMHNGTEGWDKARGRRTWANRVNTGGDAAKKNFRRGSSP